MPFIGSPQNNNMGQLQQGWNMIMSLYGQKKLAEREQQQQENFHKQFDLQQRQFSLTEQNRKLENEQLKIALDSAKEAQSQRDKFTEAVSKEREAKTLTPKRMMEIYQEIFPQKSAEMEIEFAKEQIKAGNKTPNEIELIRRAQLGNPEAIKILTELQERKVRQAQAGREVFAGQAISALPGVYFDRFKKKFYKNDENGNPVEVSSEQIHEDVLRYREELPTNDIRVMQQSVPSVMQLIGQTRTALSKVETGPFIGRWKEFWSGKVGTADPAFRKLKTDINLLQTRLMKMHVGARGSEYIMKHFEALLDAAKDSPENMKAAINEIEMYAREVGTSLQDQPNYSNIKAPRTPIEKRKTADGRVLVMYDDGTIEEEK